VQVSRPLIELKQIIVLAEYNQLMNQRQYEAVEKLTDAKLHEDRGAFFKSIHGTLNHIMVGDIVWLKRFASHPSSAEALSYITRLDPPESLGSILFHKFAELRSEREVIDSIIINWVSRLSVSDIEECVFYSNMAGKRFAKPFYSLINHLFLHQVHHRGQVTTLLSQFGVDFGETDIVEIISECSL
jgi:uncharacterized damage-inducible protein DinB